MRVRTSVPSSSSSFTWESLKVLPQELLGGPEPHMPPLPSPACPTASPLSPAQGWTQGLGSRCWQLSPVSQAAGDRTGWSRSGNSLPLPGGIIKPEKTGHKTRQGPLKDQLVQTQAFHRPTHYTELDITDLGLTKNRSLHQLRHHREPDVAPKTWLSQNQPLST